MKKIKIALIGAGYISDYHARALQKLNNVEIVAVVANSLASADKFAAKYSIPKALKTIDTLVLANELDAVLINTPNKFHAPYAIEFLNNGKDVFIEKPLAINANEAEKIAEATKANNKLVMVGHMWHFDEEANYLHSLVADGKLGKIIKTKGYGIHENWGPDGWFTSKELAGGGALVDMGVHAIETVRFILGNPKPKQVYAKIATRYRNYDVDDDGIIIITWDNGTNSIIESGWLQPHMDGSEASTGLYGTKGYAQLFPTRIKMSGEDKSLENLPLFPDKKEHCDQLIYDKQMEYFIGCIRSRTTPVPGLEEGLIVMKIVDAAYKSSEKGVVINLKT